MSTRPLWRQLLTAAAFVFLICPAAARAADPDGAAGEPIKVGILHSLTGTMAISETSLKDVLLMLIEEQNARGGVLGRKLVPVVEDPGSGVRQFELKARELLIEHQVAVIFGCWTSASRKAVLPVVEEDNGLLFYPVQYEGEESSRNIIYTGAAPNQQAIPAIDYLIDRYHIKRWFLLGTDYVYPRTVNRIMHAYLSQKKVRDQDIHVSYRPFGFDDWEETIREIREFAAAGGRCAVISTLNGDTNVSFYAELARQQVTADDIPVMAFSIGDDELRSMDASQLAGHMAAWNYFMALDNPHNADFIRRFRTFTGDSRRVVSDPMEAHYIGFSLWVKAVEKAGTTDVNEVLDAIIGLETPNLSGSMARVLGNHHITKPAMVGRITDAGSFEVVWSSGRNIEGDAWSSYLESNRNVVSDWSRQINCGRYDSLDNKCI